MKLTNRIGMRNKNRFGTEMIIVEYYKYNNMIVEFQDEHKYRTKCSWKEFQNGIIKNPYDKTICGVGYIGVGEYVSSVGNKHTKCYEVWRHMITRCYDPYTMNKDKGLSYINVFVCEEWYNFQNFAKWYEENYYEINNEVMCLDKDILFKSNKVYSPETCIFTPMNINNLFCKCNKTRGNTPIGTNYNKSLNKMRSYCGIIDKNTNKHKQIHLGFFDDPIDAFLAYKKFKENYIKQVADEYKDLIPKKLYDVMYRYEVEIND